MTSESQPHSQAPEYLTVKEAVELSRSSRATLYRLIDQGKLTTYKLGGGKKTFFKREDVLALFAAGTYTMPTSHTSDANTAAPGEVETE